MLDGLKKLLGLLPFDGKKTVVSTAVLLLAALQLWFPGNVLIEGLRQLLHGLEQALVSAPDVVASAAAGGVATGLLHKALKR